MIECANLRSNWFVWLTIICHVFAVCSLSGLHLCCTRRDKSKLNFKSYNNRKLTKVVFYRKLIIQYMNILVWNNEILTHGLDSRPKTRHDLVLDCESCTLGRILSSHYCNNEWFYYIKLLNFIHIGITLLLQYTH